MPDQVSVVGIDEVVDAVVASQQRASELTKDLEAQKEPAPWSWQNPVALALTVAVAAAVLWRTAWLDPPLPSSAPGHQASRADAQPRAADTSASQAPAVARPGAAVAAPELGRPQVAPHAPAMSGIAVARLADEQRLALIDKADNSALYWPAMLEREGGALLLEQALLLGVEAVRRDGGSAADSALRSALALMARPLRSLSHDDELTGFSFSPDCRTIATASADWTAVLWDAASGRKTATLKHAVAVSDIAFSADGRLIATVAADRAVRLWQVPDGRELSVMRAAHPLERVQFIGYQQRLATVSRKQATLQVQIWSSPDGAQTRPCPSCRRSICSLSPSPTMGAT